MTQIASFLSINMYMKINIYRLQCVCRLWWLLRPSRTVTISTLRARRGSRGPASWSPWTASPGWRAGELWLAESRTQYSPLIGWRQGQEGDLEQAQLLQLHGALQLLRRGPEPLQQDGPAAVTEHLLVCGVTGSRDRPRAQPGSLLWMLHHIDWLGHLADTAAGPIHTR